MPASLAPYESKTITFDDAMNAMCVWGEISEVTRLAQPNTDQNWVDYLGNHGSWVLRQQSIELGRFVAAAWRLVDEDAREYRSFDYQFVPFVLGNLEWKGREFVLPTPQEMAAKVNDEFGFENFLSEANRLLKDRYSIDFLEGAGLSTEEFRQLYWNPDRTQGETAEQVVERYATKHGLDDRDTGYGPRY